MMHHIHPLLSLTDGPELLMRQYVPAHGSALRETYLCMLCVANIGSGFPSDGCWEGYCSTFISCLEVIKGRFRRPRSL